MIKNITILLISMGSILFAGQNMSGIYIGIGSGLAEYSDSTRDSSGMLAEEFAIDDVEGYSQTPPVIVYGGYQFNRLIAIEVSITDYGEYRGDKGYKYEPYELFLGPNIGFSMFDAQFRPFISMGLAFVYGDQTNLKAEAQGWGNFAPHYSLGLQYEPNILNGVGVRVAYEQDLYFYRVSDSEDAPYEMQREYSQTSSLLYIGLQYKF